ncbi:MAG: HAD-IIB family hydrolase [Bryobacteraceae bacterium]|nr:HAD-IIB family hydrolase [Bryobacteraceae bacterium]
MHLVFTDLDGTLLDHDTYAWEPALPALTSLEAEGSPVIFVSSKTRAEMEVWRSRMANRHPFISENGGAIFIPCGYFPSPIPGSEIRDAYEILRLGDNYAELVRTLKEASLRTGVRVLGFADMTDDEVAEKTALTREHVHMARQREFDEAFLILDMDRKESLLHAIEQAGKRWTQGGRFFHITGDNSKAAAVGRLLEQFRTLHPGVVSIGLGDGPNDIPFLRLMDIPVIIPSAKLEQMTSALPHARVARAPGPEGWNQEILAILGRSS